MNTRQIPVIGTTVWQPAAYTLNLVLMQALIARGKLSRNEAEDIMETALALAEAQPGSKPENVRASMTTRFHLEKAAADVRAFAEEGGFS